MFASNASPPSIPPLLSPDVDLNICLFHPAARFHGVFAGSMDVHQLIFEVSFALEQSNATDSRLKHHCFLYSPFGPWADVLSGKAVTAYLHQDMNVL